VQGAGDQFFAGARLTLDQHVGVGRCHLADLAVHVLHGRARTDDADLAIGGGTFVGWRGLAVGPRFGGRGRRGCRRVLAVTQDARHGLKHFIVIEGFGDVVHRAHLHRVHRRSQAGVAGHDQHRRALAKLDQLGARGTRQAKVADDQVEGGNAEAFLGFLYRAGFADLVLIAFEQPTQGRADDGFVFDDQNVRH